MIPFNYYNKDERTFVKMIWRPLSSLQKTKEAAHICTDILQEKNGLYVTLNDIITQVIDSKDKKLINHLAYVLQSMRPSIEILQQYDHEKSYFLEEAITHVIRKHMEEKLAKKTSKQLL